MTSTCPSWLSTPRRKSMKKKRKLVNPASPPGSFEIESGYAMNARPIPDSTTSATLFPCDLAREPSIPNTTKPAKKEVMQLITGIVSALMTTSSESLLKLANVMRLPKPMPRLKKIWFAAA